MKNKYFCFLIFFLQIYFSNEIDFYCGGEQTEKLKIGDNTTLCIHFNKIGIRMDFSIEVDKFSLFNIAGGYLLSERYIEKYNQKHNDKQTNVSLTAQIFNNITTFPALFYHKNNDTEFFFPLLSIVIKVEKGEIYDIVWDNNCYSCKNELCMEYLSENEQNENDTFKNCMNKTDYCKNDKSSINCDPKFYITWFGTDKDNRQMKSSNMAFSKFKHYSIGNLYDNLCESFKKKKEEILNNFDEINNNVNEILKDIEEN